MSGLKTIYTGHLLGGLGNALTIEDVSCSHEHVDFGENVIRTREATASFPACILASGVNPVGGKRYDMEMGIDLAAGETTTCESATSP